MSVVPAPGSNPVCILGACVVRDASGYINDTISGPDNGDCLGMGCHYGWNFSECISNKTCAYGISNFYQVPPTTIYNIYLYQIGNTWRYCFFRPMALATTIRYHRLPSTIYYIYTYIT